MGRKDDTKQIDAIAAKAGLTKGQRRILHEWISGQDMSYRDILEVAYDVKKLFPNK